ncbi:hypothetical protein AC1031_003586 [Aphanomyces cochlioides]|nr:hypothetical protein AC1031_003586 [Aphanomyces cochlioides]
MEFLGDNLDVDREQTFMEKHGTAIAIGALFLGFLHFSWLLYSSIKPIWDEMKTTEAEQAALHAKMAASGKKKPLIVAKDRVKSKKDQ